MANKAREPMRMNAAKVTRRAEARELDERQEQVLREAICASVCRSCSDKSSDMEASSRFLRVLASKPSMPTLRHSLQNTADVSSARPDRQTLIPT